MGGAEANERAARGRRKAPTHGRRPRKPPQGGGRARGAKPTPAGTAKRRPAAPVVVLPGQDRDPGGSEEIRSEFGSRKRAQVSVVDC